MADRDCRSCGDQKTEEYELLVRSNQHKAVHLCEECHAALEEGFVWED